MNEQKTGRWALAGSLAVLALLITLTAAVVTAQAPDASLTVCPPPGAGCDYTTIQAAIDTAAPGDTIRVAAGTYTEHLSITLPVTIEGGYSGPPDWLRDLATYETIVHNDHGTTAADWDGRQVAKPAVIRDGTELKMWYDGANLDGWVALGLATSTDGVTWTKSISNPVLAGTPGSWDSVSSERGGDAIKEEGIYKLWYEGSAADGIRHTGYATSTDGITWHEYAGNPVVEAGPDGFDAQAAGHGSTLHDGATYRRWYHAIGDQGAIIAYATAPDEVTWTKQGPVLRPDPGGWDGALWGPSVLKRDGTYWMWYSAAGPLGPPAIGVVTSTDGINWTRFLSGPVVSEPAAIGDPVVIDDGGLLKMWYNNFEAQTIHYAESLDGIHWTLHPANPVLEPGELANWGSPVVRLVGASGGTVLDGLTLTGGSGEMGGGVRADDQDLTLRRCLVRDNWAYGGPYSQGAGGVVNPGGLLTIADSRIVNNQVEQGAGGIRVHWGTLVMTNVLVADNHGDMGVHLNGAARIVNATIANNDGGVLLNTDQGGTLAITNSIVYYNGWGVNVQGNGVGQVAYSDVEGGWHGVGNTDDNPVFAGAAGGDYHLSAWSPVVDRGTPDGAPGHDLDGTPRDAVPDMGAYEFSGTLADPILDEVAASAGVDDTGDGLGVAWGDYDGDGDEDLFVAQGGMTGGETDVLYASQGDGTFADAGAAAGVADGGTGWSAAWGDYDNDGDGDLYVARYNQPNLLYRNNGDGTFAEVGAAAGVDSAADNTAVAWADYDADGWLDLLALGYQSDHALYHNQGDGTFADVAAAAGLAGSSQGAEGAAWGDYDDDGDQDLYIAQSGANTLWRNNGDGTFADVTAATGTVDPRFGRGATWGDLDNDGDLDLYVTNYGEDNALYRNDGATFVDIAAAAGVNDAGNGIGVTLGDYDNDGDLDVWVANDGPNALYLNNGDCTFARHPGLDHGGNAHGAASADYDGDGDLDVYVTNRNDGNPNLLYRNRGNDNHWLHVRTQGSHSSADGTGARVRVVAGGLSQIREVSGGSGFASHDSLPVEFGLGAYDGPVTVEVTWPSGVVDTIAGVAVDQVVTVVESNPPLHDVAVVSVSPDGQVSVGMPFEVQATLRNVGSQAEAGVQVTCEIEHGGATVYSEVSAGGEIEPAAWQLLDFPAYTPQQQGDYTLTCRHTLAGDSNPANDSYTRVVSAVPHPPDAWTRDNPDDDGSIPSGYDNWYTSPDVWVRHQPDGGLIHQDPIEAVANTVYVRLRNRGQFSTTGTLDVYWIESSLGVRCGDWAYIGTVSFADLEPGEVRIVSTTWVPVRSGHTCLQTVIDASGDPFNAGLECAPQWVPYDNNVSWRNVEIYPNPGTVRGGRDVRQTEVRLVNVYDRPQNVDLVVERRTFPQSGTISIRLPADLFDRWQAHGAGWGAGIEVVAPAKEIRVTGSVSATIGAMPMLAGEVVSVGLTFEGPAGLDFQLVLRERIDGWTVGGVAYHWVIPDTTPPAVLDTSPTAGSDDVAVDAPLVVAFDEEVAPLHLQLTLSPDPGGWFLLWNAAGTVVTATHGSLEPETTYHAGVMAEDGWGNAMGAPLTWSFTTAPERHYTYLPLVIRH